MPRRQGGSLSALRSQRSACYFCVDSELLIFASGMTGPGGERTVRYCALDLTSGHGSSFARMLSDHVPTFEWRCGRLGKGSDETMRYRPVKYQSDPLQNFVLLIAAISGISMFYAKATLAEKSATSAFMHLEYFFRHIRNAALWPYVYWIGAAVFVVSLLIAMVLQYRIVSKRA